MSAPLRILRGTAGSSSFLVLTMGNGSVFCSPKGAESTCRSLSCLSFSKVEKLALVNEDRGNIGYITLPPTFVRRNMHCMI